MLVHNVLCAYLFKSEIKGLESATNYQGKLTVCLMCKQGSQGLMKVLKVVLCNCGCLRVAKSLSWCRNKACSHGSPALFCGGRVWELGLKVTSIIGVL